MQDKQDKRRSFQEAQQSYQQVFDVYSSIEKNAPNYGTELKHVKQEVNEGLSTNTICFSHRFRTSERTIEKIRTGYPGNRQ